MSVRAVDVAIHRLRAFLDEMGGVDPEHWLPEHTLHALVDPILSALGWDPSDLEESLSFSSTSRLTGYSLSADPVADDLGVSDLVVLATSVREPVSSVWSNSEFILSDVVALTDGTTWCIYDRGRLVIQVDVIRMRRGTAAGILTEWLGRANFG